MPTVGFPAVLSAGYNAALRRAGEAPTTLIPADSTFFRAFDQTYFTVDTHRRILQTMLLHQHPVASSQGPHA
jgi:hypothetical protein